MIRIGQTSDIEARAVLECLGRGGRFGHHCINMINEKYPYVPLPVHRTSLEGTLDLEHTINDYLK